ncbi:MAG: vitamin B12 dependent-methionine synthase activation domain-containing protein [Candidatus Bathyarchaeota archaeon]
MVQLDSEKVLQRLHLTKEKHLVDVQELTEIAHSLIEPKVVYDVSQITSKNGDTVDIDGVRFTSRVLRVNLERTRRVFPYVMTIGKELENRAASFGDVMKKFCLETIGNMALDHIGRHLEEYLLRTYRLGKISEMNPGSLEDWPITQQKQLFSILGNVERLIGVTLTDSFMMTPRKSVSGIYFPTETMFYNCQLCRRRNCEERQAPYDKNLEAKYARKA